VKGFSEDSGLIYCLAGLNVAKNIKKMSLQKNNIGDEIRLISFMDQLTHLNLSGNNITDNGARGLAQMQGLTDLDLGENRIGIQGTLALNRMLNMKNLSLQGNRVGQTTAAIARRTGVQWDDFDGSDGFDSRQRLPNRFGNELSGFSSRLSQFTSMLTSSFLGGLSDFDCPRDSGDFELPGISNLMEHLDALQRENLSQMQELLKADLGEDPIDTIYLADIIVSYGDFSKLLKKSAYRDVKKISIVNSRMTITTLKNLPQSVEEIEFDDMKDFRDDPIDIFYLVESISHLRNLRKLSLKGDQIDDAGAESISKMQQITELRLSNNQIGNLGATKISQMRNLTVLDLENNHVGKFGCANISELPLLKVLNLNSNEIADFGAGRIGRRMELTSLSLAHNQITDEGAEALSGMKQLESLDLRGNQISNAGAQKLAQLVDLKSLDLRDNLLGPDGETILAHIQKVMLGDF
jgi:Leucine-rich repeat (LRR) protein